MKHLLVPAAAAAALVAACLGPADNAPPGPYRDPSAPRNAFHGMPNDTQNRHLYSATFPRLQPGERQLLRRVNNEVNRDLVYLTDLSNYGLADRPVTEPAIRRPVLAALPPARYGDCEDYALTKKHRLIQAGFSPSRAFVAMARVPERTRLVMHTVLAVPEGGEWWILNNWDDDLRRASALERWWEWEFIRPRYDHYLDRAEARRTPPPATAAAAAGGARP
jgi:predicted transglutaminase-like cysteine proteinase